MGGEPPPLNHRVTHVYPILKPNRLKPNRISI